MMESRKAWVLQFVRNGPSELNRFYRLHQNVEMDVKAQRTEIYSSEELLELLQAILDGEKEPTGGSR